MSRTPIHPGEILADELAELKMSAPDLARALHVPPPGATAEGARCADGEADAHFQNG